MVRRPLGSTGVSVSPIGFGAFKIGRNIGIKYPESYELPDERIAASLLGGLLDLGVNLIDTAPAYGVSEERVGRAIAHRRDEFILATKVGETFEDGRSNFDFSARGIRASIERSRSRLSADVLDIVSIHSDGNDLAIINDSDAVPSLQELRAEGKLRWIGFSGKTVAGAEAAMEFADVLMVEYHLEDRSHEGVIAAAAKAGIGVLVKKPLASGRLDPRRAIPFVLEHEGVSSAVVGGLNLENIRQNLKTAEEVGV